MFKRFDMALMCAKVEELAVVQSVFRERFERISDADNPYSQIYRVEGRTGEKRLLLRTAGQMGHMAASALAGSIISAHQPSVMLLVGTAASLDPKKVQLGDVVVPRKAVFRLYDKVSEEGQQDYQVRVNEHASEELFLRNNVLCAELETQLISPRILEAVAGVTFDDVISRLRKGHPESVSLSSEAEVISLRDPKLHLDEDIFSCGMVVDSVSYRNFINRLTAAVSRKSTVIDMETFGFFSAISASSLYGVGSSCSGIAIRGISDYAGRKSQTELLPSDWKSMSMTNAALVAAEVIAQIA
ncbi:hypothetical protein [Oceanicola sp. 22II-s10i]|uniref:phosphorylase family protein n=1 Tax=Oceanicola sp. 22II-s10i TaxID=1317116 RepID=UPI000B52788C|nr:hypothetical protein [Oceanicola sp. 22II-s10i]